MAIQNVPVERARLALHATWELESIGEALVAKTATLAADDLVIRALAVRVRTLARAIMSAIDDDNCATEKIRELVEGASR